MRIDPTRTLSAVTLTAFSLALLAPREALAETSVWERLLTLARADGTLAVLKTMGIAVAFLFGGWLLGRIVGWAVYVALRRAAFGPRLVKVLHVAPRQADDPQTDQRTPPRHVFERGAGRVAFWLVMLLSVVAALEYSGLSAAAAPLQALVSIVLQAMPLVGKAVLILVIALLVARLLRRLVSGAVTRTGLDVRFAREIADGEQADQAQPDADQASSFGQNAGAVVFWLVMFVGLVGALDALRIASVSGPLSAMLGRAVGWLPALGGAAITLLVGYVVGRLLAAVVRNLLASVGADRLPERLRLESVFRKSPPSRVVGVVTFFFVMLHAVIVASGQVGLTNLSAPLTSMINLFWTMLPSLLVAAVIVLAAVVFGRLLRRLVEGLTESLGLDRLALRLGYDPQQTGEQDKRHAASEIVGIAAQVAVILLGTVQALNTLGLTSWAVVINGALAYGVTRVAVALVIVAAGLVLGNYLRDLVSDRSATDDRTRAWLAGGVRIAVLIFTGTMALQQLNVAPAFVLLAFGLPLGALCLALALAFGLGSQKVAGQIVDQQYRKGTGRHHASVMAASAQAHAGEPAPQHAGGLTGRSPTPAGVEARSSD